MVTTRCKFKVQSVRLLDRAEEIEMSAICGRDGENKWFSQYTPSGSFRISVTNPAVFGKFRPGQDYYLDLTPVEPIDG